MTFVAHHSHQAHFDKSLDLKGAGFWLAALIGKTLTTVLAWQERAMQRRHLLALDDSALKDFGRSRCDAVGEGSKRFWQA
jgi:uncharacterized protein YjiS (DUF1127 family)